MTHDELKNRALANPEVRSEYDALAPEFDLLRRMLQARSAAGMTQSDVAVRMGSKREAIARLESSLASGKHSPSLVTLQKYARAVGHRIEIHFVKQ